MASEWGPLVLGKVCTKIGSGATPRGGKEAYRGGATALIRSQNIYNDRFVHDGLAYIDDTQADELRNVVVKRDDVLLNITGDSVARCCQVAPDVLPARVNQHVAIIRPKADVLNARFLRYSLVSPSMQARLMALASAGATRNALTKSMIEALVLDAPEPEEQRAIAEILGTLDDRIDNLRQTNAMLQAIAATLFKSRFVDFDGVPPQDMQESELGLIPKGWRAGTLSDLCELKYGKALKATERRDGETPVYGSGGIIGYHDEALVTKPTIIVGRKGTVGALYWQSAPCFPIDTVFYVESKVSLNFCYYAMMRMGLHNLNTDAAVPGLNRDNAYRQSVVTPSAEEMAKWDAIASDLRARMDNSVQQAAALTALRDTLLPRLISGQLRVKQ